MANDIEAVERILYSCGYQGELSQGEAKPTRFRVFHRGELPSCLLKALREAGKPLTARELACRICHADNLESQDRRLVSQVTARIGGNLRKMKAARIVTSERASRGRIDLWRMATDLSGTAKTFLCAPSSQ